MSALISNYIPFLPPILSLASFLVLLSLCPFSLPYFVFLLRSALTSSDLCFPSSSLFFQSFLYILFLRSCSSFFLPSISFSIQPFQPSFSLSFLFHSSNIYLSSSLLFPTPSTYLPHMLPRLFLLLAQPTFPFLFHYPVPSFLDFISQSIPGEPSHSICLSCKLTFPLLLCLCYYTSIL